MDQITPKVTTHVFWQYLRYGNGNIEDYAFREVNKSSVTFQIKTRTTNYTDIHVNNLTNLPIIPNRPYKVIIHGYNSNSTIPFVINATKEYLKKDNFNVITVDWSPLAFDDYPVSTGYLYGIGKHTGNLLIALNRTFNIPFEKFHLVGVSLGAQLAGFVGSHVQNETGHSVGRISGVDPGGALFNRAPNRSRLDRSDALFVDVMHTDWGIIGARYMAGHVDFFPDNGVAAQPYCRTTLSFITKHFSKYNQYSIFMLFMTNRLSILVNP